MRKETAKVKAEKRLEWAEIAEKKSAMLMDGLKSNPMYNDFAFWSEPIKIGHHSEGRHRRSREAYDTKMQQILALDEKAKLHRSKAENLFHFANRNKGDAERQRDAVREAMDAKFKVGDSVRSVFYGECIILKVNTKTYRVKRANSDSIFTEPKHFFELS